MRSCLTHLLKFLEEVTAYFDEGSPVDVLYLDFSKAFDTNSWLRKCRPMGLVEISGDGLRLG